MNLSTGSLTLYKIVSLESFKSYSAHHIIVLNITAILAIVDEVEMSGKDHPGKCDNIIK